MRSYGAGKGRYGNKRFWIPGALPTRGFTLTVAIRRSALPPRLQMGLPLEARQPQSWRHVPSPLSPLTAGFRLSAFYLRVYGHSLVPFSIS